MKRQCRSFFLELNGGFCHQEFSQWYKLSPEETTAKRKAKASVSGTLRRRNCWTRRSTTDNDMSWLTDAEFAVAHLMNLEADLTREAPEIPWLQKSSGSRIPVAACYWNCYLKVEDNGCWIWSVKRREHACSFLHWWLFASRKVFGSFFTLNLMVVKVEYIAGKFDQIRGCIKCLLLVPVCNLF